MIGNDIVDLALAKKQSNWQRKGFVDKIFTTKEKLLIQLADTPEIMVWSLWSRKEAVYKIFNRCTNIRAFNPLQFECFETKLVDGQHLGKVICKSITYFTKTEINTEWISTIAVSIEKDFLNVYQLKRAATIGRKRGMPFIYDERNLTIKPISISNHGRFERIIGLV